ncbi:MAG: sarcosine oxidase subunit gamma [Rhodospirillaceae bacterium]|nr:sarcosine oxidase subunit gamma [Rhodospirillaceae bacterium]MBT6203353.1 sarcosine oxidase subunit gamma [Rhodospirillaceae bacterium]MBT7613430.1 sarcosine oxidase subunit gamma [Rhodospirillaceae bacterium]MBT7647744.1 sarcosine oxidase subunit gamma [Rhodospirillaceae bacterium]
MAETYQRQSPLAHRALDAHASDDIGNAAIVLAERRFLAKINIRGKADSAAVKQAIGVALPTEPNTVETGNNLAVLWLGPAEWMVVGPPNAEGAIEDCLNEALAGASIGVVDVTEGRTTIRVSGPMARDLLSMGCPLDLHPRSFGAGRCAQSSISRSPVILHQVDEAGVYDIFIERSQSDYLWTWMETGGGPYGIAIAREPETTAWRRPAKRKAKAGS